MEDKRAVEILKSLQEPEAWEQPMKEEAFEALLIGIKAIEERKEMINAKKAMNLLKETKEELTKGTTKGSPVEGIISAVTGIMISKVGLMMQGKI